MRKITDDLKIFGLNNRKDLPFAEMKSQVEILL